MTFGLSIIILDSLSNINVFFVSPGKVLRVFFLLHVCAHVFYLYIDIDMYFILHLLITFASASGFGSVYFGFVIINMVFPFIL